LAEVGPVWEMEGFSPTHARAERSFSRSDPVSGLALLCRRVALRGQRGRPRPNLRRRFIVGWL